MSGLAAPLRQAVSLYSSRAGRRALLIVALLTGVFFLYRPSSDSLVEIWNDQARITYTHGFIIAALAAWLVLRRRDELAELRWQPGKLGGLLAVLTGVVWILAVRSGIEVVHQVLLVVLMWLSVWALCGWRMAWVLWLPVGFLMFAVPIWDVVNSTLQSATVVAVQGMLKVVGIPAWVEGNFVHLAAGVFEVAGGCSGIHFFLVSIALGTLYGEIGRDTLKLRAVLLALAIAFALLTNWVRVFIIVVAGYLTDMQHYLVRVDHYNFGWGVFAVMMLGYLLLARRIAPPVRVKEDTPPVRAKEDTPPMPLSQSHSNLPLAAALLSAFCVALVPAWEILRPVRAADLPAAGTTLPPAPQGWASTGAPAAWNPIFAGADRIERAAYVDAQARQVAAYAAIYASQRQNKELVAYGNSLVGEGEGAIVATNVAPNGDARELIVENGDQRELIRYYYQVGQRRTQRNVQAQVWYGLAALRGGAASSVIALRTPCVPDCDAARALLDQFH